MVVGKPVPINVYHTPTDVDVVVTHVPADGSAVEPTVVPVTEEPHGILMAPEHKSFAIGDAQVVVNVKVPVPEKP